MPPVDGPSPSPSAIPPASGSNKRPRQFNAAVPAAGPSRTKRRKAENSGDVDGPGGDGKGKGPSGTTTINKGGKEDEWPGDPADLTTKIDFHTMPVDALYRYLEAHELLPRFDPSPWSEDPCIPPNALYSVTQPPATAPATSSPTKDKPDSPPPVAKTATAELLVGETDAGTSADVAMTGDGGAIPDENAKEDTENSGANEVEAIEETPAPPTTRSKTAPMRKPPTPEPSSPPEEEKRGVITLSDVEASRAVLAEKANAHWVKGLGGGQNKEGETIVNFLYKLKAGPTRLLRVYNPWPAT